MKAWITALLVAALLAISGELPRPSQAQGQSVVIVLALVAAAGAGGMLIWVLDKASTQINMRWVILERGLGHSEWCPVETNRIPVAPTKLEAFPSFFVIASTNSMRIYRVRLAESWEIPQSLIQGTNGETIPIVYDQQKLNALLTK